MAQIIELGDLEFPRGQNFLRLPQTALDARDQVAIRVFQQKLLKLRFGQLGLCQVAIGLSHQPEMRHPGAELRHRGFRRRREEGDEIFVLGLRLREPRDASLVVIRVRDGQLGFGKVFAVGISV